MRISPRFSLPTLSPVREEDADQSKAQERAQTTQQAPTPTPHTTGSESAREQLTGQNLKEICQHGSIREVGDDVGHQNVSRL
jgi:hypothetical protein